MNELLITKDLKSYFFRFNRQFHILSIYDKNTHVTVAMDKVRMLSLARFILRCLSSMTIKTRKSK